MNKNLLDVATDVADPLERLVGLIVYLLFFTFRIPRLCMKPLLTKSTSYAAWRLLAL